MIDEKASVCQPVLTPQPPNARREGPHSLLTFDVEDWFQTENLRGVFPRASWDEVPRRVSTATHMVLDFLAQYRLRATFFVLGWVAEREPSLVREIARAGHEVACHGYGHVLPTHLTAAEFRADIQRARGLLEDLSGQPVIGYRAPSFNLTRHYLQILADSGFRYDSSLHPFSLHDRYTRVAEIGERLRPGIYAIAGSLVELPLPVERWGPIQVPVSGGGYFRLVPPWLFRRLVRRRLTRDGHYMMYLHSWEFDVSQPRIRGAGLVRTFRHYNHLSETRPRMHRLIRMLQAAGAEFITAREFISECAGSKPEASSVMAAGGQVAVNGGAVKTATQQGVRVALGRGGDETRWDAYVARHPEATAYHLFGWRDIIEESYGHKAFYLMAERGGDLVGVLPLVLIASRVFRRCLVSLPFLDYGGVLADDSTAERLLTDEAVRVAREARAAHVELRHSRRKDLGLVSHAHKVSMRLDLPGDPLELWNRFPSKLRSQIRRAQKEGCDTRIGGVEELDGFYAVFAENMRDLGTPVHSKHFFRRILERFPGMSHLCVTRLGRTPIAGSFLVSLNSWMEVQWASSLKRFSRLSPNMLLYWTMLEYACRKGVQRFDFGRSTPGSGTYRFKEQWGATPTQLYWDYWLKDGESLPALNYANPRYASAIRMWRRLPLAVANRLGPPIIKHIPA